MDEHALARLQAPEFEQAVTGRAEGHRDACRFLGRQSLGDNPAERLAYRPALGMGSVHADGHHPITHPDGGDPVTDGDDRSGTLVPDDVGDLESGLP